MRAVSMIDPNLKIHVKLIGDGEERDNIQSLINQLGVGYRVTIAPFMDQQRLWEELQHTDLMCHACDYEGLSKIIIESMSVGLPVLVSDVAPLNNYITDSENGFLAGNEPALWAAKIESVAVDIKVRCKVSENSMNYIRENYNPARNVKIYEKHFNEIIGP